MGMKKKYFQRRHIVELFMKTIMRNDCAMARARSALQ